MNFLFAFPLFLWIVGSIQAEDLIQELRSLKSQPLQSQNRPKRAIKEHLSDMHCLQKFETSEQTIIRTVESQKNGAVFLNVTTVDAFELCLASCCESALCNVAIFDEQGGSCFLFDCGPPVPGEFLCRFTSNDMFTSGALEVNRHEFEDSQYQSRESHANELTNLLGGNDYSPRLDVSGSAANLAPPLVPRNPEQPKMETPPAKNPGCGIWQFTCGSGDCIAGYDVCDGIPQCEDGSDETPEKCPSTTIRPLTTKRIPKVNVQQPIPTVARPQNVNKWGREGEKMNPNQPVQQPVAQPQQPQTAFQHRGNMGLQVPYGNPDPRAYGNGYGYPQTGGAPVAPYGYPQQNGLGYGYQQPPPNYPADPYNNYYGQAQQPYPGGQQPQPQPGAAQATQKSVQNEQTTTRAPRLKSQDSSGKKGELAPTEPNPDLEYQNFLLKDLKPKDFEMETPIAAYFTLIVGSTICFCVCFVFCCRVKHQKRRGRKRNLASDAGDGDYLVNGMYL